MEVVFYVAHVDDETLFAGGTIHKAVLAKKNVHIVYASNAIVAHGRPGNNYRQEADKIATILGVRKSNMHFLNIPTMEFEKYGQLELNKRFESLKLNPDLIVTHSEHDVNKDHKIVFESAMVQARCYQKPIALLCCEYIGNSTGFHPNFYVDITNNMYSKIKALQAIDCEMEKYPHQRSYKAVWARAMVRGSECGVKFAEAYEVKRWILK